ncbi:MAG: 4-(cytidine 5'-diphospho)-2-C-methyl-D-erythritol kinase [bacterium]|nr:4-(cytidine 5'-diphospho)-2-C-methyl-D-erythritol kinase [Candidatus Minthenecus merdequi]
MLLHPNAKINIGLNIIKKRPDGYHDISTVMYPIPLRDELEITKSKTFSFSVNGIPLSDDGKENLVVRAWRLVDEKYKIGTVNMTLRKNIPSGAGLGGGSADAAFTICGLNEIFGIGMSTNEMEKMASKLGADCAFFVKNGPALCKGIGDVMTPIELSLTGMKLVLIKPDISIPTPEAYRGCTPGEWKTPLEKNICLPIDKWKNEIKNDFEKQVFAQHPLLDEIKNDFYADDAIYSAMSGSGSTIYGIYNNNQSINILQKYKGYSLML